MKIELNKVKQRLLKRNYEIKINNPLRNNNFLLPVKCTYIHMDIK